MQEIIFLNFNHFLYILNRNITGKHVKSFIILILSTSLYSKQIDTVHSELLFGSTLNQMIINQTISYSDNRNDKFIYHGINSENLLLTINGIDSRARFKPYKFDDYFQSIEMSVPSINPDIVDNLVIDYQQSLSEYTHGAFAGFHFRTKRKFEKITGKINFSSDEYLTDPFVKNGRKYNNVKAYVSGLISESLPIHYLASVNLRNQNAMIAEDYGLLNSHNDGHNFYGFLSYDESFKVDLDYQNISNKARPYDHSRSFFGENRYKSRHLYDQQLIKLSLAKDLTENLSASISYQYNNIEMESGDDKYWTDFAEYGRKSNFDPPLDGNGNPIQNDDLRKYGLMSQDGSIVRNPGTYSTDNDDDLDFGNGIKAVNSVYNIYEKSQEEANKYGIEIQYKDLINYKFSFFHEEQKYRQWGVSPRRYIINNSSQETVNDFYQNNSYRNYFGYDYTGRKTNDKNADFQNGATVFGKPNKNGAIAPVDPSETSIIFGVSKKSDFISFDFSFNYHIMKSYNYRLSILPTDTFSIGIHELHKDEDLNKYFLPKLNLTVLLDDFLLQPFYNISIIKPYNHNYFRGTAFDHPSYANALFPEPYSKPTLPQTLTQYGITIYQDDGFMNTSLSMRSYFFTFDENENIGVRYVRTYSDIIEKILTTETFYEFSLRSNFAITDDYYVQGKVSLSNEINESFKFQYNLNSYAKNFLINDLNLNVNLRTISRSFLYQPRDVTNYFSEVVNRNPEARGQSYIDLNQIRPILNLNIEKVFQLNFAKIKVYLSIQNLTNETFSFTLYRATDKPYTDGYLERNESWQDTRTNNVYKRSAYRYAIQNPYNKSERRKFELGLSVEL
jgi:hypothetical protein